MPAPALRDWTSTNMGGRPSEDAALLCAGVPVDQRLTCLVQPAAVQALQTTWLKVLQSSRFKSRLGHLCSDHEPPGLRCGDPVTCPETPPPP